MSAPVIRSSVSVGRGLRQRGGSCPIAAVSTSASNSARVSSGQTAIPATEPPSVASTRETPASPERRSIAGAAYQLRCCITPGGGAGPK